jgi:imidazolonepropionase-like amidohydrolase
MSKKLIKNGTVYTMVDKEILEKTDILIEDGIITEIGKDLEIEEGEMFDLNGAFVMPGMIDAHCHIGLSEEGISKIVDDANEMNDPVTPHLRVLDGINPLDTAFREAFENGITTVAVAPGSANIMAGQFAVLKTFGNRIDNMMIDEKSGIKVSLGENPISVYGKSGKTPATRMAIAAILRETLLKAEEYMDQKSMVLDEERKENPPFDMKLESLLDVIDGSIPLRVHAHRADDIFTAIRIAKEFNIDIILEHCTEGHLIADQLAAEDYPVVFGPAFTDKSKYELRNLSFRTAAELVNRGIKVAFMTDAPEVPIKYLPICAGLAVKEGLDEYEALKCITINAAEILRIDDSVGSIEVGKDADIAVFTGNPIRDLYSQNILTLIDGVIVSMKGQTEVEAKAEVKTEAEEAVEEEKGDE